MSEIYFIRHGQASFGEENYDRLSPLGVRQAQFLAKHLAKIGKLFDGVYYGEMERQQNTAREFIDYYTSEGLAVFEPVVSDAFNEYDSFGVWQALILEISWQLLNASITRIKYNSRGMMLAGFNEVSHLELKGDKSLITYR